MKHNLLYIAVTAIACGCHRSSQQETRPQDTAPSIEQLSNSGTTAAAVDPNPSSASAALQAPDDTFLLTERRKVLFIARGAKSEFDEDALAEIRAMVPRLQAAGMFWDTISALSTLQKGKFRNDILSALRALEPPDTGQKVNREFNDAYRTVEWIQDPEIARIALEKLPKAVPYIFPNTPPPPPWSESTPEGLERLPHGAQGLLATTVVKLGDEATLAKFREQLKEAPPTTQRVMIWALGNSPELADFNLLMALREKITDPGTADTLIRALNKITQSMHTLAESPESFPAERRPKDPKKLLKVAEQCKAHLVELKLIVNLTLYD